MRGATRAALLAAVLLASPLLRGNETFTKETTLAPLPLEHQADYDIEYGSVDAGNGKRRVIVTRPRGAGKHPAVLFLGGIGCYSLDGLLRPPVPSQPYAKILDALTRAGYVTMRVEKSGMGDSEGPPCMDPRSDFEAEVRGYAAGLRQLESYDFVDAGNVFLFAHSIGPLDAARIAAEHPVRAIAVAETIGTSWIEYDLANVRRQLLLGGMPYDDVDRRVRRHEVCAHRYFIEKNADAACVAEIHAPAPQTYMQQLGALDLAPLWKKIEAPVLIFYGTADFVTDRHQSEYLRDMINSFHEGRAKYVEIEGMDHGLRLSGSQKAALEGKAEAPFAQQLVDDTLRFFDGWRGAYADLGPGPLQQEYERPHPKVEQASNASCTPSVPSYATTEISIERTACYGSCPRYTLTLRSDGTAEYRGYDNVDKLGTYRGTIAPRVFDEVALVAEEIGFFDAMQSFYACPVTDSSTVFVSMVRNGQRKTIRHYAPRMSGPARLRWLEALIDQAAEKIQWQHM